MAKFFGSREPAPGTPLGNQMPYQDDDPPPRIANGEHLSRAERARRHEQTERALAARIQELQEGL